MKIDHIAIWTDQLEVMKKYYMTFFGANPRDNYCNRNTHFESCFLSFDSGARIELMSSPDIPANMNNTIERQYLGIIHLAFGLENADQVYEKYMELQKAGFPILDGPRKTGDGYYEFVTLDPGKNRIEVTTKLPI